MYSNYRIFKNTFSLEPYLKILSPHYSHPLIAFRTLNNNYSVNILIILRGWQINKQSWVTAAPWASGLINHRRVHWSCTKYLAQMPNCDRVACKWVQVCCMCTHENMSNRQYRLTYCYEIHRYISIFFACWPRHASCVRAELLLRSFSFGT